MMIKLSLYGMLPLFMVLIITQLVHSETTTANNPPAASIITQERRQLQRVASICADSPTDFSTSLFMEVQGDGTSFQQTDLNALLELALMTYNDLNAQTCDPAFRTLSQVSVGEVFYTDSLDYIRLRYDVGGSCQGCVTATSGTTSSVGPLFGGTEPLPAQRSLQQRGIKGSRSSRELQKKNNVVNAICACSNAGSAERGPTAEELGTALNLAIQEARADNIFSGAVSVGEIFEAAVAGTSSVFPIDTTGTAQQISCAEQDIQDFTTNVWLQVVGSIELTPVDIVPVEVAIAETFNEMNLLSCDNPFFRKVADATYLESRNGANGETLMNFEITGKCLNCDPSTITLLDLSDTDSEQNVAAVTDQEFRPPSRALLISEIERITEAESQPMIVVREVTTDCVCLLNQDDLLLRSPKESEFARALQATLDILDAEGLQSSIGQVKAVIEGELESSCPPGEPTEWISAVYADFEGSPNLLESDEIFALETGFSDTYNQFLSEGCDEYFRGIESVRLIPGITRRRLQGTATGSATGSSQAVNLQNRVPSVYLVKGKCRNCPISRGGTFNMFDDAFRRMLLQGDEETLRSFFESSQLEAQTASEFVSNLKGFKSGGASGGKQQRELQLLEEDCTCPLGASPEGPDAPSSSEFTESYNQKIVELKNQGAVRSIDSVLQVQEVSPYYVTISFSILYGSLERLGTPTDEDLGQLARETGIFYSKRLRETYGSNSATPFRSASVNWKDRTVRSDIDRLEVMFEAEFVFEETETLPSKADVVDMMQELDYVEYITDYVWPMKSTGAKNPEGTNPFEEAHTILFQNNDP